MTRPSKRPSQLENAVKNIRGNVGGTGIAYDLINRLIRLWQSGRFPFDRLTTTTYQLDQINDALADRTRRKLVKPLLGR